MSVKTEQYNRYSTDISSPYAGDSDVSPYFGITAIASHCFS